MKEYTMDALHQTMNTILADSAELAAASGDADSAAQLRELAARVPDPLDALHGAVFEFDSASETQRSSFNRALRRWRAADPEARQAMTISRVKRLLLFSGVTEATRAGIGYVYCGIRLTEPSEPA